MGADDPSLDPLPPVSGASEIRSSVILDVNDFGRLSPVIQDRRQRLVPNTTCASCHKLNPLRFDFHNLSYLEDRGITVSPRVERDVAYDLDWLGTHLGDPG